MVQHQYTDDESNTATVVASSFLSWTDTLNPESAASINNTALRLSSSQNLHQRMNPLEVVYHEISSDDAYFDSLPVAVQVVQVDDDENNRISASQHAQQPNMFNDPQDPNAPPEHSNTASTSPVAVYRPKPWRYSNTFDLVFGFLFAFVAWVTTIKLEITAFLVYACAALFHVLAERISGRNPGTLLCKSVLGVLSAVMMAIDAILILVSVLVTEIFGALALFLCTFLGGSRSGAEWHLFIRRLCHLTRWGFRSCLTPGWKPDRVFPISESVESASLQSPPPLDEFPEPQEQSSRQNVSVTTHYNYSDHPVLPRNDVEAQYHDRNGSSRRTNNDDGMILHDHHCDDTLSTLTTATTLPSELPPVTVAAEHVHVLNDENGNEEDGFLPTMKRMGNVSTI